MSRHVKALNICELLARILLLAASVHLYFTDTGALDFTVMPRFNFGGALLIVTFFMLAVGMLFRIIPNRRIAIGARKHFTCSYRLPLVEISAEEAAAAQKRLHRGAFLSGLSWAVITAMLLFALFLFDLLTPGAVVVIALFYSVIDLVFILTFCPFRALFMRNRCCTVCRIYNWDYFMMCAPLIVFPSVYSVGLFLLSVAILIRWELAIKKNVHFFMPETNEGLRCELCEVEHYCRHTLG